MVLHIYFYLFDSMIAMYGVVLKASLFKKEMNFSLYMDTFIFKLFTVVSASGHALGRAY